MFPCLPRTASLTRQSSSACPMRVRVDLLAAIRIPPTRSTMPAAAPPLRRLNLPVSSVDQPENGRPSSQPNPVFCKLHKTEFGTATSPNSAKLATCNATRGNKVSSACIFHDITVGNNDVPCFGPNNCFPQSATKFGVLSINTKLEVACGTKERDAPR